MQKGKNKVNQVNSKLTASMNVRGGTVHRTASRSTTRIIMRILTRITAKMMKIRIKTTRKTPVRISITTKIMAMRKCVETIPSI